MFQKSAYITHQENPRVEAGILGVQDSTVYYSVVCGHPLGDRELGLAPVIGT